MYSWESKNDYRLKGKNMKRHHNKIALSFLTFIVGLLAACASTPPPTDTITRAEVLVDEAEEAGSQEHAPLELRNARKKLQDAQAAFEQEEYKRAKRLAEQAQVDAQLAEQKALSAKAKSSVREIESDMRLLRQEIGMPEN